MTDERWLQLVISNTEQLTQEELDEGWHFCCDWDGLLVGPGMGERRACSCRQWKEMEDRIGDAMYDSLFVNDPSESEIPDGVLWDFDQIFD